MKKRRQEIRDIEGLIESLQKAETAVGKAALIEVNRLIHELHERRNEVERYGTSQFTTDSLSGVGSVAWREFLRAAKTLAEIDDRGGNTYPQLGDCCLLCRQGLSSDAIALIRRMWDFFNQILKRY